MDGLIGIGMERRDGQSDVHVKVLSSKSGNACR